LAQPTPYVRSYSFSGASGAVAPGPIDQNFDLVRVTLDQILNNLELIQRDDTEIANETIGYDQFKPEVAILFTPPTAWVTATAYTARVSTVFSGDSFYQALTTHTSGVFATDLAAGKWELIADFGDLFASLVAGATQDEVNTGTVSTKFVAPSTLKARGRVSEQGTDYTVLVTDLFKVIEVDASGGTRTVTLPSAVTAGNGAEVTIAKSDQSGYQVVINSFDGAQLLNYPGKSYALHGTPGTAISNNGGFVRAQMVEQNYGVFRTGDKVRISGTAGLSGLNADFVITKPTDASLRSYDSVDLTLVYSAGYTGGGTVAFIQTSHRIRAGGGVITYVSNGNHWVVKFSTSDVFLGAKDDLFASRNADYAGPAVGMDSINDVDGYFNAFNGRLVARDIKLIARGDPGDLALSRTGGERFGTDSVQTLANSSVFTIFWQASAQDGSLAGQMCTITVRPAEDVTTVGNGSYMLLGSTPYGKREAETFLQALENGEVWIGGANERGTIRAYTGRAIPASMRLTASANVADGDTVTIDTVTYTFESGSLDAASGTAVEVKLGADVNESMANLLAAINATGTSGTTYGAGATRHPTVHAVRAPSDPNIFFAYARTGGVAGNSIAIAESSATLVWLGGATALSGGADINQTQIGVEGDPNGKKVTVHAEGVSSATQVGLRLDARSAYVHTNDPLIVNTAAGTSITTAGNETLTAAQLLGGIIVRDCTGAGRTDTLPTAALLVAAIPGAAIGDTVRCWIVNGSDAAETITIAEGAGGAFVAAQTAASRVIEQNSSKMVHIRLTNVTAASEAYVVYL
jgi:hypothetical protein